jgi:cytochrome P450
MRQVRLHGAMRHKKPCSDLLVATSRTTSSSVGVYDHPDRFDITRDGAPAMLTFGGGIHYCLGAHLARIELAEALTVMARRMPELRSAGPAPWKPVTGITGPLSLPVEFTACR